MSKLELSIVDVFAEEKYAGNQLAVVRYGKDLADTEMQKIARETNYSETTFIITDKKRDEGYDVRIFTPKEEVPFAGHPTLGTAYVIRREIIKKAVNKVLLNLKIGQIPVTFGSEKILWMRQKEPTFGRKFEPAEISRILGIETGAIDDRFPIETVSTGLPFILVPLRKLETVKKCSVVKDRYFDLIKDTEAKSIMVFNPETYNAENNLNVRVFVDYFGIPEDPATGSANGCLAGYLVKHRYFKTEQLNVRVEQGYEVGRPSLLYLRADTANGTINVSVGGKVIPIVKGKLL
ncbi:MAG TPA: PhzF family phenazine biosynthesis protein [Terriglobales bacterium]|nr:PhzF family phenazine biosynthesis protein [Terriglobales bacterium]